MKRDERLDRVRTLASALADRDLTANERQEFNELLRGDPEACECYLEISEIHAALAHQGETVDPARNAGNVLPFSTSSTFRRSFRKSTAVWRPLLAAAAVFALLLNGYVFWRNGAASEEESTVSGVAVLSRTVDPVWNREENPANEGDSVLSGKFQLESGLAQLEFFSGATVIVEGPAKLDLISEWEVVCLAGRLRAFVPEPARGFTIATPEYKAVDLGTEFALSVGTDGKSEVHVVDGEVRIDGNNGEELKLLHGGGGIRASGNTFETVEGGGNDFIDRRTLMQLSNANSQSRYRAWEAQRDALASDPATMVLFDFENHEPWDRQLANRRDDGPNGAIVGARWTEGRWPGKGALDFKRITDRVRLNLPGDFEALTFAAWVRVESFDRWLSSLLLTDGFDLGEVHWQISDQGTLILGISNNGEPNSESIPVIHPGDLGRWIHLAVTVDRSSGRVIHFLDGEIVARDKRKDLPPLRLGAAEIGNWQGKGKNHSIRSFNGLMDEFLIAKREMTPVEIRELYTAGK